MTSYDTVAGERSKSYVAACAEPVRRGLLGDLERSLRARFPRGQMLVPYETWLWVAHKR